MGHLFHRFSQASPKTYKQVSDLCQMSALSFADFLDSTVAAAWVSLSLGNWSNYKVVKLVYTVNTAKVAPLLSTSRLLELKHQSSPRLQNWLKRPSAITYVW